MVLKRTYSYGFTLPSQDSVEVGDVNFLIGDLETSLESEEHPAWDYESPVRCTIDLQADYHRILDETGLSDVLSYSSSQEALSVLLVWFSTATKQRGSSRATPLKDGRNVLEFEVEGGLVGGDLEITAVVCLSHSLDVPHDSHYPWRAGTTLWESEKMVLPLEGIGSRFPMLPVDFKKAGRLPSDCLWTVEIDANLHSPVESNVRVLVNIANPLSKRCLENPTTTEAKVWQKYLTSDVLGHLLLAAARCSTNGDLNAEFHSGDLGETLRTLLDTAFPSHVAEDLLEDTSLVFSKAQSMALGMEG